MLHLSFELLYCYASQASWLRFLSDIELLPGSLESSRASMIFSTCRERHEVFTLLNDKSPGRCVGKEITNCRHEKENFNGRYLIACQMLLIMPPQRAQSQAKGDINVDIAVTCSCPCLVGSTLRPHQL